MRFTSSMVRGVVAAAQLAAAQLAAAQLAAAALGAQELRVPVAVDARSHSVPVLAVSLPDSRLAAYRTRESGDTGRTAVTGESSDRSNVLVSTLVGLAGGALGGGLIGATGRDASGCDWFCPEPAYVGAYLGALLGGQIGAVTAAVRNDCSAGKVATGVLLGTLAGVGISAVGAYLPPGAYSLLLLPVFTSAGTAILLFDCGV
ncbi:MAG: hypothetical protein ACRENI_03970 [Gemmatimonadaceae bacterium]